MFADYFGSQRGALPKTALRKKDLELNIVQNAINRCKRGKNKQKSSEEVHIIYCKISNIYNQMNKPLL